MSTPITLDFTLDAVAYGRLMQRLAMRRQYIVVGLLLVGVVLFNVFTSDQPFYNWLIPVVLFAVFFLVFTRILGRRAFKAATNLHPAMHYVFSQEGISVSTSEVNNDYEWSAFSHVREMPEWFLLYQNNLVFNPIPKTAFASEAQITTFREMLLDKGLAIAA